MTRKESTAVWAGSGVWLAGMIAAIVLTVAVERPYGWLVTVVAVLAVIGLMASAFVIGRSAMRREGVERTAGLEASALAFWATIGATLTWTMVDAFADVPALRGPWVLMFALFAWTVAWASRMERYR
ncbi:hypothetical protein KOI35_13100 [Actinoplanes bogorensis]|uniref:DUF2178 domain-containing protein n=1 Tax=Paractinoplanes bogorensis TaxID=1610840 RepID=A0ABS5YLU2_9ACTN|nr:hypothetical protein [Actinoplanes bogorensis]MBU2664434.1 hypothetical protein [Actinoplanes bogorensis]